MRVDRRQALKHLHQGLILCATARLLLPDPADAARAARAPVALLLPLSGPQAAIGLSMRRATELLQSDKDAAFLPFDTRGTPEGAGEAALQALRRGAKLILGPLLAAETRAAVAQVGGKVPLLSFSNDENLRDSGAFLLGITASQVAAAILGYAQQRGVRSVVLAVEDGLWSQQMSAAGERLSATLGLRFSAARLDAASLRATAPSSLPDAVLLPGRGAATLALARELRALGVQPLATLDALGSNAETLSALNGSWIAAPDAAAFGRFARDYETRHGGAAGVITAVAYDGAVVARDLRAGAAVDRQHLLAAAGFAGVTGSLHFRSDGSCARELAILVATANGYDVVDRKRSA